MTINLEIDADDFGTIHLEASEVIRVSRRRRGQEPQISAQQSRELKNLQTEKKISLEIFECLLPELHRLEMLKVAQWQERLMVAY